MEDITQQFKFYNAAYQYYYRNITKPQNDIIQRLESPKDDFDWGLKIISENLNESLQIESLLRKHLTLEKVYAYLKELNSELDLNMVTKIVNALTKEPNSKIALVAKEMLLDVVGEGVDDSFLDLDYIKFQDCICCGVPAPAQGHILLYDLNKVRYPICSSCSRYNTKINYEKLAQIYHAYSSKIEKYMDRIREI